MFTNIGRAARFDSMVRNFFEMFLRARRALEFSHSQDPSATSAANFAVTHNTALAQRYARVWSST
jgi:hypothetical protein